jgi:hypothetical protein
MTMLALKKVLLAKPETAYGSDPTPTAAANTIDAEKIEVSNPMDFLERNQVRANLSKIAGIIGKRFSEIKFTLDLKGSGTAGTAAKIGDLLEACGYVETASVGSSVVYSPYSVPVSTQSLTFYYYQLGDVNAILRKITGARGTFNLVMEAGSIARMEFTFRGIYNAPSDVTNPTGMAYESTKPPIVESTTFTFGATSLIAKDVSLDIGNELAQQDDINSAAGVKGFTISNRKPTGKFTPEAVLLATKNFDTILTGNTETAIALTIGSVAGNKIDIVVPKAQIESIKDAEQNSIAYQDIPFRCNGSAGDDEITFKFY